jgi:hypothetical protein
MQRNIITLILLLLPLICGCSTGSAFRVEAVEGTVTLDGKTLEGATLTFVPVDSAAGKSAYARTNAQGTFKLTAVQGGTSGAGTMTGNYLVAVSKTVPSREPTTKELAEQERGISPDIPMDNIVTIKYNDAKTSGVTAEVVKGKNVFNFELKSNP